MIVLYKYLILAVFMRITDDCYQKIFISREKNGLSFFKEWRTPAGDDFDYLRPQWTITLSIDRKYHMPLIDIRCNGWYENSARLWPKHTEQWKHFLLLERTPLQAPSVKFVVVYWQWLWYCPLVSRKKWYNKIYQFIRESDFLPLHRSFWTQFQKSIFKLVELLFRMRSLS